MAEETGKNDMAEETVPVSKGPQALAAGSLAKVFIVVFIAALVGSYGGITLSGLSPTGQVTNPSPSPSAPNTPPAPSAGGTVRMADIVGDATILGNPNAPVTLIEFSDAQCPFCGRHFQQTHPQIVQNYVNTGKVRFAYRHFPLSFHPEAQPAAEAMECAKEQGKFWEFHDKLFANQQSLSTASYKQWAGELGLNTQQFNSCFDSGKYRQRVLDDFAAGNALGVSGTPTFFIGKTSGQGNKIVGAQAFQVLQQEIENALA